jgi:hypothetical protein
MVSDVAPAVLHRVLIDGALLSIAASAVILLSLRINPRLWLQDFPKDIQDAVPPKTAAERRLSLIWGIPFLAMLVAAPLLSDVALERQLGSPASFVTLWLNGFGVLLAFNLVDLIAIDWLVVCRLTPAFVMIPGTEGLAGYRNYRHHARGFLVGTAGSAVIAALVAALASMG